jgi:hypothetical protein
MIAVVLLTQCRQSPAIRYLQEAGVWIEVAKAASDDLVQTGREWMNKSTTTRTMVRQCAESHRRLAEVQKAASSATAPPPEFAAAHALFLEALARVVDFAQECPARLGSSQVPNEDSLMWVATKSGAIARRLQRAADEYERRKLQHAGD